MKNYEITYKVKDLNGWRLTTKIVKALTYRDACQKADIWLGLIVSVEITF